MSLNIPHIKGRFRLFDSTGLSPDQVRILQVLIWGVLGGTVWGNITTGAAMTGYIKDLGASDTLYGFVFALPFLANGFQLFVSYWMERTLKRTELFMISGFIQRLVWFPFALVPLLIPMHQAQLRLWCAVILALVSACMGPAMNVSFFSFLNDVVPIKIRGRYLAVRSRVATIVGLGMGILVARLLDILPAFTNYIVVFAIAGVFGTFDICCFLFCKLPPMQPSPEKASLPKMLKSIFTDKRYMRLVLSISIWLFCVQLGAPFFNVFSLSSVADGGMGMSKTDVIFTGQVMYNAALILLISRWGRAMDQYGAKPVLVVSAFLTAFMPMFWFRIGPGMLVLAAISNFYSGSTYCAVDLSMQSLFMGQAPDKNRSMYFAVYFIFTQLLGLALGSMVGGLLLDHVLVHVESLKISLAGIPFGRYHALFVLTTALRVLSVLLLLSTIDDGQPKGQTIFFIKSALSGCVNSFRALYQSLRRRRARRLYSRNQLAHERRIAHLESMIDAEKKRLDDEK